MHFNRNILKDFARLCNLAYRSGEEMSENYKARPYNLNDQCSVLYHCNKNPEFITRGNDSQMYICKYDDKLSVIFRGTESKRDILTDLNIIQIKMPIANTREKEYPDLISQLDLIYHDIKNNNLNNGSWIKKIDSIKEKYPKPE